jgi:hypothetical protein
MDVNTPLDANCRCLLSLFSIKGVSDSASFVTLDFDSFLKAKIFDGDFFHPELLNLAGYSHGKIVSDLQVTRALKSAIFLWQKPLRSSAFVDNSP